MVPEPLSPYPSTPNGSTHTNMLMPSVTLNYQGIGSGGGKKAIIDNTVDFAGSDSVVSAQEYTDW